MGAYAEAIRATFPGALASPPLPTDTGWVVLMHDDVGPTDVRRLFPGPRRLLVLSPHTEREADDYEGVAYGRLDHGPPPQLSAPARAALADGYGAAVLLDGLSITSGRVLLELARAGVKRVAWRSGTGWAVGRTRSVALRKPVLRVESRLARSWLLTWYRQRVKRAAAHSALRQRNNQRFPGEHLWLAHLERFGTTRRERGVDEPLSIMLSIGQLNSGGAERQLCNLAIGLQRRGHKVTVLTSYPLTDENAHYCDDLRAAGIEPRVAGSRACPEALRTLRALDIQPEMIGSLPEVIRNPVLDLAGELLADPPDVLHCWLDYPNIVGAAAGALAGAPHIVLSTRNVNPTHFPAFYQPWMDAFYSFFTALPQVHLLANSGPGADDYARWLGLARSRFEVIHNGVDLGVHGEPTDADAAAVRAELGLTPDAPLIVGVFRLAPEKQPVQFLDVIARVRAARPDVSVALVGVGELRARVEKQITARYLGQTVHLLGQRKDVGAILRAADVLLLTSAVEGTPNVILEAQWAGTPPVATAAGGTADALRDGVTGHLHPCGDIAGMTTSVLALLADPATRRRMGEAGREFVGRRFSLLRMVDDTEAFYEALLQSAPTEWPLRPFVLTDQAVFT